MFFKTERNRNNVVLLIFFLFCFVFHLFLGNGNFDAQVQAVSNGCYEEQGSMKHKSRAEMFEPITDTQVFLGQSIATPPVTVAPFQMGSVMIFQGELHCYQ